MRSVASAPAILIALCLVPVAVAENPPQRGETSDCVDVVGSTIFGPRVEPLLRSPLSARVAVEAGSRFVASAPAGDRLVLLFFDAGDRLLERAVGAEAGAVPAAASYATVCVQRDVDAPGVGPLAHVPSGFAAWRYQDGY